LLVVSIVGERRLLSTIPFTWLSPPSTNICAMLTTAAGPEHAPDRVPVLDVLRLVAVLGVVSFHYGFRGPTAQDATYVALPELAALGRYGFLGVSVFFVISGFVIAYSAEGRTGPGFAIARFARIYPTYLLCMTLTFLGVLLFGAPQFGTSFTQWAANLSMPAVVAGPYMDSAYWSLAVEIIFYGWVTIFIWLGLFPKRTDFIVAIWLGVSLLNELTVDIKLIGKFLLADYSGFFATGIMIYQFHRGRRDALLQWLMAASIATAIFHAIHNLEWLRQHSGDPFDDWIVAAICLVSIAVILFATRIRHLPLPPALVLAIGGITYPLYLLHQQLGYALFERIGPVAHPALVVAAILLGVAALSWAIWRFVEPPVQRWTRKMLTGFAGRMGPCGGPTVRGRAGIAIAKATTRLGAVLRLLRPR
jgi:peptidoglycan/LPS O-acetylase OafA/YrhL